MKDLRNIAIIAHVDHGKTTLVDRLLQQSGTLGDRFGPVERVMDGNDLEKERGITILSKNTALKWNDYRINIVDTPGHADFGGEVERVLSMVDSVLLLVDAVEGPMPQTRFVTQKAFEHGLRPIVVVNKIDRDGARPDWVVDQTFDLFDRLGGTDEQLDFPVVYASAIEGYATLDADVRTDSMDALFQAVVDHAPEPDVDIDAPFQMQISSVDYSNFVGVIGIGRVRNGKIKRNSPIAVVDSEGKKRNARVLQILGFHGLQRVEVETAQAGDIIAVTGIEELSISDTLCDPAAPQALPALTVDQPTVTMMFQVNTSPFSGKEGKFVTSRQILERLDKELIHNVALRVSPTPNPDMFEVAGRGELHLSILLETMRREGFEIAVSRPQVIYREIDGVRCEPFEDVDIDIEEVNQGAVMEAIGARKGELRDMQPDGKGRVRLVYFMPARGLIGFQTDFMTLTSGTGLINHVFSQYAPVVEGEFSGRRNGALISMVTGKALAYALWNLQERGKLMLGHGAEVYEGQVIGIHSRRNDLVVNPLKGKQLTNVRASGKDDSIVLEPPMQITLESALELIEDDELVEITPANVRIRKKLLSESDRKRAGRVSKGPEK